MSARTAAALLGLFGWLASPAGAAPTFPVSCIVFPEDCAGSDIVGGAYGTNGIGDEPVALVVGTDTTEVALMRVTMNTAAYPSAVCNDGSPAVFYFAAAPPGSANARMWVIALEGGGACLSGVDEAGLHTACMDRWTGKGNDLLDFPRRMSTDLDRNGVTDSFLPPRGKVPGLLGYDTVVTDPLDNGGADAWNRVYINYCSSDSWLGQSGSIPLSGGTWTHPIGGPQPYEPLASAYFNGHHVIESVLDAIQAGVVSDDATASIILAQPPDMIVFAGDSAGGTGVIQNLDWLSNKLFWGADAGGNRGITRGVAGATSYPPFVYDDTGSPWYEGPMTVTEWDGTFTMGSPDYVNADVDMNGTTDTHRREAGAASRRYLYETYVNAFLDQTCLGQAPVAGLADPDQRDWICNQNSALYARGDITTPLLIKQDLADPLIMGSTPNFEIGVVETLTTASPNIQHFGPWCGHHETLSSGGTFHSDRILDGASRDVSYHTAISEFIAGTYVSIYHQPGITTAVCSGASAPIPTLPGHWPLILVGALAAVAAIAWRLSPAGRARASR